MFTLPIFEVMGSILGPTDVNKFYAISGRWLVGTILVGALQGNVPHVVHRLRQVRPWYSPCLSLQSSWIWILTTPDSRRSPWRTCGWRCWAWWAAPPATPCSSDTPPTSYSPSTLLGGNTGSFFLSWELLKSDPQGEGETGGGVYGVQETAQRHEKQDHRVILDNNNTWLINVPFTGTLSTDIRANSSTKNWFLESFPRSFVRMW